MKIKLFLLLAFTVVLVSCGKDHDKDPKKDNGGPKPVKVEGFVIKNRVLNENVKIPGTILSFESTEIQPEVSGRIVMLNVQEGSFYKKGTLIAKINSQDLQARLSKLQIQLEIAENQEKRQAELLKIKAIGQQEYDGALLSYKSIQADIEILKTEITKTEMRAPFDGVIGFKMISPGAYVTPQTKITTINQVNKLKLEFSLPEKYTSQVKQGMDVYFKTDSSPKRYNCKVFAIEPTLSSNTRSLNIRAEILQPDKLIQPGMFANVELNMNDKRGVIMVPSQAIIPKAREKKVVLYKSGIATFTTVTLGLREASDVEITSGLNLGDTILVSGLLTAKPDSKVILTSMKN